jgi:hypothetical protein
MRMPRHRKLEIGQVKAQKSEIGSRFHNHLYSGYRSLSSTLSKEEYELHYLTPELIYVVLGMSKRKAIKFVHKHNANKQKQILSKK